jgi:hypothetical protein
MRQGTSQHLTWLTPKRMRVATVTPFIAATGVSSIGLSGSTTPTADRPQAR